MQEKIQQIVNGLVASDYQRIQPREEEGYFYTYRTELLLIGARSLFPNQEQGVSYQWNRLKEEMALFPYYQHDLKGLYTDEKIAEQIYPYVGLPLLLANTEFDIFQKEILLYLFQRMHSWDSLFSSYLTMLMLFLSFHHESYHEEKNQERIKDGICQVTMESGNVFSQEARWQNKIQMERGRIKAISSFHQKDSLLGEQVECFSREPKSYLASFYGLTEGGFVPKEKMFLSYGNYLYLLQKGQIPREKLYYSGEGEREVFSLNMGEKIKHSILGEVLCLEKIEKSGRMLLYVETQFGKMRFHKRLGSGKKESK